MTFKLQITVEEKWQSLPEEDRIQQVLENSDLWQLVKNHRLVTAQVTEMNKNVPEEFHVHIPTHYWVDK